MFRSFLMLKRGTVTSKVSLWVLLCSVLFCMYDLPYYEAA